MNLFEKEDPFVPSLKINQIIQDDEHCIYKILAIKHQNSNEIVYDALREITFDFPPHRQPIEVVEKRGSMALENFSIRYPHNFNLIRGGMPNDFYHLPPFIVNGKVFYCRFSYDFRKVKIGDSLYLGDDQYRVIDSCGHGSYGEILKLQCISRSLSNKIKHLLSPSKKNDDHLALKQFQMSQSNEHQSTILLEETAKDSFVLGYEAMHQLSHPNIIKVFGFYLKADIPCFTMEFINGINLREYVERNGILSFDKANEILQTITKTINYCHEKGIHHGDLKPNNVMITNDGVIKIIDFAGNRYCPDDFGIVRIFVYLLTGKYLQLPPNEEIYQKQKDMVVTELKSMTIPDDHLSYIVDLLDKSSKHLFPEWKATKNQKSSKETSMSTPMLAGASTGEETSDSDYQNQFVKFSDNGLFGLKNQEGEVVIPPIYSFLTPVGRYHIPGPGPRSGWDIVGVMTLRDKRTGWYEIVDKNKMKLVLECTSEEIKTRQMMT